MDVFVLDRRLLDLCVQFDVSCVIKNVCIVSRLLLVTMAVSVYQWYRLIGHKHLIPAQMLHIAPPWSPHPSHSYNPLLWQFQYFITTGVSHQSDSK